ncbi:2-dehydro-3-deoxy-6-phosphogalactonate aldolase [Pseudaminobacter soli (ex Zhang et al. 2022)]|nr:2-dehydro-3-deoxy-6-phosphogalactonate aldolase [Pseudaminobacter soli]
MSVPFPSMRRGIVAILRGLRPEEAVEIGSVIYEAGIEAIEVPLNSPDPFRSIEALVQALPAEALIGGGTVLRAEDVDRLKDVGGRLLVSPNIQAEVMMRATDLGLVTLPGVFTPTEAFQALRLGASALKFFPASVLGPSGIAAMKAVLPKEALVGVVGGVSDMDFAAYAKVGVRTFGLGSSLFKPGMGVDGVSQRAIAAADAWDRVFCAPDV